MQDGVKLKSTSLANIFAVILITILVLLILFILTFKLISSAENLGVQHVNSFTDTADKVINKHATILESSASNLSYFMKKIIQMKMCKGG